MRFVVAPDSFKGTLSTWEVIEVISRCLKEFFNDVEVMGIPIADGGEGTLDALSVNIPSIKKEIDVSDPLGNTIHTYYLINGCTAYIEIAKAVGLPLVPNEKRNPLYSTSIGVGQMVKNALESGIEHIFLTLGGSSTNDGGIGALSSLGFSFYDNQELLEPYPYNLESIKRIDTSNVLTSFFDAKFTLLTDVVNPLLGKNGATYVFGPQKGASLEQLSILEKGMTNYISVIEKAVGKDIRNLPGAGAAGGMGVGFIGYGKCEIKSGIDTLLDIVEFNKKIKGADLVITGEGKVDTQSFSGKVIDGISKRCQEENVRCICFAGKVEDTSMNKYISDFIEITPSHIKEKEIKLMAESLLEDACMKYLRDNYS